MAPTALGTGGREGLTHGGPVQAINTSSVTLLPTGVIALRAAAGSSDPAGILPTTLFATTCSTITAILAACAYLYPV